MTLEEIDAMEIDHWLVSDGPRHDQDVMLLLGEVRRLHDQQAVLTARLENTASLARWLSVGLPAHLKNARKFEELIHPGDLVVEVTTAGYPLYDQYRLGWMVCRRTEPCHTDEEWTEAVKAGDYAEDASRPEEPIIYLRLPSGTLFRWRNARFVRLPQNYHEQTWAVEGKAGFKHARRCADCGTCSYAPPEKEWTLFDPETGACRNCHGLLNRPTQEEIDAWNLEIAGHRANTQSV